MDFHYMTPTQANSQISTDPSLEFDGFDNGDVFYAELRRQVLLLTADHNDDFPKISKPRSNTLTGSFPAKLQPGSYFNWWEKQNTDPVPAWLVKLWSSSNGTGVFIPQTVKSRRRYTNGNRMNDGRRQVHKQAKQNE